MNDILRRFMSIFEHITNNLNNGLLAENINMKCPQMLILDFVITKGGKVTIKDIVTQMEKKKSTVTENVNSLEKKGFLVKYQSEEDRRVYYVESTDKADDLMDRANIVWNSLNEHVQNGFSEEEKHQLYNLLDRTLENIISDE
ncbi:MarR family winged helix-turn-helix transcriptional regulator [Anaeromicrobium sediminis]|uniref:HTH marR-type domain-containing protein n=1 Tax=Anaeromicrobium sediminis TaxID=1478221 RepID=A0A267MLJ2_9FIRM|nr:MarR family winged helix-turn-helix transcriptional regulator [Anaeromicrobium sediminis]PAB60406.1 hypothetical protein CCE28_05795 [Anaeromicrobium sediminis]